MLSELYDPPYHLDELKIELTRKCLFNCIHCSSHGSPGGTEELEFTIVQELIDESKKLGISKVVFSGGEPLLWPGILDIISNASQLDIDTCIYTTGRHSPEDYENGFSKELKRAKLNRAIFSVYGKERAYEKITRIGGSYQRTISKIRDLQASGIEIEFHFVPMKINFRELSHVVNLARDLGINKLSILRFVPHGRGALLKKSMNLSGPENLELRDEIRRARQTSPSVEIRLGSPYNFLLIEKDVFCKAGINTLIITPDGSAYPCDAFKNYKSQDNDSIYLKSLKDIWNNSHLCQMTRAYLSSEPYDECQQCINFDLCKSGCLAQKVIANSSFKKDKDPDCIEELMI